MAKRPHKLFDRVWAWNYLPANLEGCFVQALFILAAFISIGLGLLFARAFDSQIPELIGVAGMILVVIAMLRFMKRHS